MKVYYIFDSYCGWCYGFETILKPFIEAHPELEVTALSGGLFMDGHSLSAFPYMSDTNKRIADMFGVEFGKPYMNLLETGSMVPDSNGAAIGFGVLRSFLPKGEHVNLASKMHEAFYLDGKSLSDVETIKSIAKSYDLPADKIAEEFIRISEEGKYHPDFYEARKIGVTSFPMLFLEINGKHYDLKGSAITLNDLEENLNIIKAKSGYGIIITEDFAVTRTAGASKTLAGLWEDRQVEPWRVFTDRIHKAGAKTIAQIYHAGRETSSQIIGEQPIAPSAIKDPTMPETPREMSIDEIHDLEKLFVDAALWAKAAGFDGVEVHGAHGYLINQFVSPFSNKRCDEYGGTTENRRSYRRSVRRRVRIFRSSIAVDTVVIAIGVRANTVLEESLTDCDFTIVSVGDCHERAKNGYRGIQEGYEAGILI